MQKYHFLSKLNVVEEEEVSLILWPLIDRLNVGLFVMPSQGIISFLAEERQQDFLQRLVDKNNQAV